MRLSLDVGPNSDLRSFYSWSSLLTALCRHTVIYVEHRDTHKLIERKKELNLKQALMFPAESRMGWEMSCSIGLKETAERRRQRASNRNWRSSREVDISTPHWRRDDLLRDGCLGRRTGGQ